MTLKPPFIISSRLMPAVKIDGATLSIGPGQWQSDGRYRRMEWSAYLDMADGTEYPLRDFQSGIGRADLQSAFVAMLNFLSASAESYRYRMLTGRNGENEDLFAPAIVEWAYHNSDEIDCLALEIEETPNAIED